MAFAALTAFAAGRFAAAAGRRQPRFGAMAGALEDADLEGFFIAAMAAMADFWSQKPRRNPGTGIFRWGGKTRPGYSRCNKPKKVPLTWRETWRCVGLGREQSHQPNNN